MKLSQKNRKKYLLSLRDDPDKLIEIILEQDRRIKQLEEQLEDAERAALRPAAPFRRPEKKHKKNPKTPGRKKDHPGSARITPSTVDQTIEVPLTVCPECGFPVDDTKTVEQYIEEIPPIRPHVTRLITHRTQCKHCGTRVRSSHPLQVSHASGAAGVHLGPRALSLALELVYQHGLTKRKTRQVLKSAFNLSISPGGLIHASHRIGKRLNKTYQRLKQTIKQSHVLHADETSWWVGGPHRWLWVFTNPDLTLYQVCPSRAREVIRRIIGDSFNGVLVSDCLNIYDDVCRIQHKCYSHHLNAISKAIESHPKKGGGFLLNLRSLLQTAIIVGKIWDTFSQKNKLDLRMRLERRANKLLKLPRGDPGEESIRRRLLKQQDHLFTFLDYPGVDPTNNLAERQLRPAVIARKLSCGNKTPKGARTWQILTSISASSQQNQLSFRHIIEQAVFAFSPS